MCHITRLLDQVLCPLLSPCVPCKPPLLRVHTQLFKNLESYWDKLFKQVKDEKGTCEVCTRHGVAETHVAVGGVCMHVQSVNNSH